MEFDPAFKHHMPITHSESGSQLLEPHRPTRPCLTIQHATELDADSKQVSSQQGPRNSDRMRCCRFSLLLEKEVESMKGPRPQRWAQSRMNFVSTGDSVQMLEPRCFKHQQVCARVSLGQCSLSF